LTDIFTKQKRSEVMARVRSSRTRIELSLKSALEKSRLRFAYQPGVRGRPDFIIEGTLAVFVNGCFWHCCPRHYREPKSNVGYWREKALRNRLLLDRNRRLLRREGYSILSFWEHDIEDSPGACLHRIWRSLSPLPRDRRLCG
jgi:DNA mismatch endonuclease (patch repair protein)